MHVGRCGVTIRAGGLGRTGTGLDKEQGVSGGDVFYHKAREAQGKQRRKHTSRDTSHEEDRFCVSLKYTPLAIVWPCSTEPAEEPLSCGQLHLDVGSSPHGAHTSPAACTMPAILCGRVWA